MTDEAWMEQSGGQRLALMVDSFARLTGGDLLAGRPYSARALWEAPLVVVAHATQADPIFFYGNRMALDLFEMDARAFTALPSRLSAEAPERAERDRLMAQVKQNAFIADYAGVRISATGKRFRIEQAFVWNILGDAGLILGQAACFGQWTPLD